MDNLSDSFLADSAGFLPFPVALEPVGLCGAAFGVVLELVTLLCTGFFVGPGLISPLPLVLVLLLLLLLLDAEAAVCLSHGLTGDLSPSFVCNLAVPVVALVPGDLLVFFSAVIGFLSVGDFFSSGFFSDVFFSAVVCFLASGVASRFLAMGVAFSLSGFLVPGVCVFVIGFFSVTGLVLVFVILLVSFVVLLVSFMVDFVSLVVLLVALGSFFALSPAFFVADVTVDVLVVVFVVTDVAALEEVSDTTLGFNSG